MATKRIRRKPKDITKPLNQHPAIRLNEQEVQPFYAALELTGKHNTSLAIKEAVSAYPRYAELLARIDTLAVAVSDQAKVINSQSALIVALKGQS